MAAEGGAQSDIKVHKQGYALFVSLFKWGAIISFLVAMFIMIIIA